MTYVLAEQEFTPATIKAVLAQLGIVSSHAVADLEVFDFLWRTESARTIKSEYGEKGRQALTDPTAATTPTVSWPGMSGNLAMNSPSWMC